MTNGLPGALARSYLKASRWAPQPGPQTEAITADWCPQLLYGGAAGGGKSDFLLGDFLQDVPTYGSAWQGIMFRRTYGELEELIARARDIYPATGGEWFEQKHSWRWPNGAALRMRYLERDHDATRYQGHSYCVAVGTLIVMSDGSQKSIESVRVGEFVATLEGPRRVLAGLNPYFAPCVRVHVIGDDGIFYGEQFQPVWHPVLSASGVGWLAYSADDQIYYTTTSHLRKDVWPLPALSFPVALHAPTARSAGHRLHTSSLLPTSPHVFCKSTQPLLENTAQSRASALDHGPPPEPRQLDSDRFELCLSNDHEDARPAMRKEQDCRSNCPNEYDFCGELAHALKENDQDVPPSRGDAEDECRAVQKDALGTIRAHSHPVPSQWAHPYTGEARCLSEEVIAATAELEPCGYRPVCDLMVESANHYITSTGLINKNTWIGWDELTHWASPYAYRYLRGRLRSAHAVPTKRMRAASNPGSAGHQWVKAYFVTPAPMGFEPVPDPECGMARMFIPAKLSDNRILLRNDPGYVGRLRGLGSVALVKALLDGDWSVVEGAFYEEWSNDKHVVAPFAIPDDWLRFRSVDWGSARPFSVGWWAVVGDGGAADSIQQRPRHLHHGGDVDRIGLEVAGGFPRGALIRYREWYGASAPDVGLKLTAEEVANGIVNKSVGEKIAYTVVDPSMFRQDGGPSLAERFIKTGVTGMRPADNTRIPRAGAMGGWDMLRHRLRGDGDKPMIYFFSTCVDTIRTLPALQHDRDKPEDVAEGEDHAADEIRYACSSRPWIQAQAKPKKPTELVYEALPDGRTVANMSIPDIIAAKVRRKERNR